MVLGNLIQAVRDLPVPSLPVGKFTDNLTSREGVSLKLIAVELSPNPPIMDACI